MANVTDRIKVWDLVVRFGHWTLAAAFFIAYFTAEELEDVHVAAGYWVGGYVVARTIWGFVGTTHARFSDFVRGPRAIFSDLVGLVRGAPAHYIGHNPAGGIMIVALLICLAATATTGLAVQADSENEGALARWLGHPAPTQTHPTIRQPELADESVMPHGDKEESQYEEAHELFANLTMALVILHLLGVGVSSWRHRENLVRAMITGFKPVSPRPKPADRESSRPN